jgi:predicted Rossmann fold nucleotide-binding protein DprA/Smf involved in DNA uptake
LEEILPLAAINMQDRKPGEEQQEKPEVQSTKSSDRPNIDNLRTEEATILKLIGNSPIYSDNIITDSGYQSREVLSILLSLELKGYIEQLPGKRFIIKK